MKPDAWRISDPDGELATAVTLRPQNPVSETGLVIDGLYSAATIRKWLLEEPSEEMLDAGQLPSTARKTWAAMIAAKLQELEQEK